MDIMQTAKAFFMGGKAEQLNTEEQRANFLEEEPMKQAPISEERITCPACGKEILKDATVANKYVCYRCGHYFRMHAKHRIKMMADEGSFVPWFEEITGDNPLDFPGYEEKLAKVRATTGMTEGVLVGKCSIYGISTVIGAIDSRFLMGSMGHAVGERIASAVERATQEGLPVVLFCCSGGARMQEGIVSLMQMAKTSAALKKHSDAGLLYISVLTDPTTGGVTASFAMLGDIILAEPGALIGFAGPRVIEQTIGQKLPAGFQRAEFQLQHGFVDAIVPRPEMKATVYNLLSIHSRRSGYSNFKSIYGDEEYGPSAMMMERSVSSKPLTAWEKVAYARNGKRQGAEVYMDKIFDSFMEMHGDRYYRDDPAIKGGIALLDGQPVTVIGICKGTNLEDCISHNFGMPSPEGYRKALRLMKQAEKFNRPIITFVNTSGAYPGMEAEENGQGEAIARNLYEMAGLKVPILTFMIGEGGSGGALALAVGNEVWMMENAVYSILSPEGFASILWKDKSRAKEAAETMKITAEELKKLHIIEQIIPEYGMADADALDSIAGFMKRGIRDFLVRMEGKTGEELAEERYQRFRRF